MNITIKYLQKKKKKLFYLNRRHNIFLKNIINTHYKNAVKFKAKIIFFFLYLIKNKLTHDSVGGKKKCKKKQCLVSHFYKNFLLKKQMRNAFVSSFFFKFFVFKLTLYLCKLLSNIHQMSCAIRYIKYFFFRYKMNYVNLLPVKLL
nr:hypothetical protein CparaKRNrm1_p053 [Cryptomonas paramecium]